MTKKKIENDNSKKYNNNNNNKIETLDERVVSRSRGQCDLLRRLSENRARVREGDVYSDFERAANSGKALPACRSDARVNMTAAKDATSDGGGVFAYSMTAHCDPTRSYIMIYNTVLKETQ